MGQNGFSDGVELGGLYTSQDIKLLVCYMLMGVGEPMQRQHILDVIFGNGMANFFETENAIDELIRLQNVEVLDDGRLALSPHGQEAIADLSGRIPYTLRERSVKAALQLLTRIRRERENAVIIEKGEHGCVVTCRINDAGDALMSLSLRVADELQAAMIKEHFLNDPVLLYRSLIAILTGDAGFRRNDTQIQIDLR